MTDPRTRRAVAAALALCALAAPAHADPVVTLTDPAHDDFGPGDYVYPSGAWYVRGQYDLRRFEARVVGDDLELRVTLDSPIRPPIEPRTNAATTLDLQNGLYVQQIDIYLDTAPGRGTGFTAGIPGRRVDFDPEQAWDHAIVLTPQPYKARALLQDWGLPGAHVTVPTGVYHEGPTVIARVPLDRLGGKPEPHWGYAISVCGAAWDHSFQAVDRLVDDHRLDIYTLPVHTVAEDAAFGGGEIGARHTQVIDAFTPPERTQKSVLGGRATLAMIYPDRAAAEARGVVTTPAPAAPATPTSDPDAPTGPAVASVLDTTVVITRAPADLAPFRLGEVIGPDGAPVGKLVVNVIKPEFVTATIVEGLGAIHAGMAVRFPGSKE